jgi:hypothetical protein
MQMRSTVYLVAATLLAGAAPAHAVQANGQSAGKAQNASANGEKKICKRLATSGSRMAERVCLTKAEWKKVNEEARS